MTTNLNRQLQIYKLGFVFVLITALFCLCGFNSCVQAQVNEDENLSVDYSKFNIGSARNSGDTFFKMALESEDDVVREEFLKNASAQYYILSNIDKSDIYPCIQLARIYDMQKNDAYAKAYFYRALGLNYKNADANFYFANFYYTRKQYKKALEYYQKALTYGRNEDFETLKKIGQIYERFGDIPRANHYYKKSIELNPKDSELKSKINDSVKQEYEKSGYYKRRLRN